MFERSITLVDELRAEIREERIRLAQLRDGRLTAAELIVKLAVWEEHER